MKTAYSLNSVNRSYQEPNINRYALKFFWEDFLQEIAGGGFKAIEMPFSTQGKVRSWDPFSKVQLDARFGGAEEFTKLLNADGIDKVAGLAFTPTLGASFEGPFVPPTVDSFAKGIVDGGKALLETAKDLGCEYVVISASPAVASMRGLLDDENALFDKMAAAYGELADIAGDIKICIRNEFWGVARGNKIFDLMAKVDKRIGICVSLAHIAIAGVCPIEFIKKAGDRIGCVTLTDTSFEDKEDLWQSGSPTLPKKPTQIFKDFGQGSLDLKAIFAALKEVGFDGWATVENSQTLQYSRSILRSRYALDEIEEA